MILNGSQVDLFHKLLCERAGRVLAYELAIPEPANTFDWKQHSRCDKRIVFEMIATDSSIAIRFADKVVGGRCRVFPLYPRLQFDVTVWAAWADEWQPEGHDSFHLVTAGWTFFWGTPHYDNKEQLLRAEWDNLLLRGGKAAQPHWHFDRHLVPMVYLGSDELGEKQPSGETLEELRVPEDDMPLVQLSRGPALQDLHLSGLHLGMGGWTNSETHPDCWQFRVKHRDQLVRWAELTLSCATQEFEHRKAGTPAS